MNIAVTHPGKMGDMFASLPTALAIARQFDCQVDFYTSKYCQPAVPLLEYQSYIRQVVIPDEYVIQSYGQGVQPWEMPTNGHYDKVYHLGIQKWPGTDMVSFCGKQAGIAPAEYGFECPAIPDGISEDILRQRPILISCSSIWPREWYEGIVGHFRDRVPVIQLGWPGEELLAGVANDKSFDFLNTASLMRHARIFASGIGANTVMSVGFPNLTSIINLPSQGIDWRHNIPRDHVIYLKDGNLNDWIRAIHEHL